MQPVGNWINLHARQRPAKIAIVDDLRRLTYAELDRETDALAAAFSAHGVHAGNRVGILAGASVEWVLVYLSIVKLGAIATALNYRETPDRLVAMMQSVGVSLLFTDTASHAALSGLSGLPKTIELSRASLDDLKARHREQHAFGRVQPTDGNVILFTGGTTGVSKGVLLSHANLFWNVINEVLATRITEWDTTLLGTALHHSAALNTWLLPHLYLGGTAVILREFTADAWIDMMQRERVTNGFTPPTMARQMVKHPNAGKADWRHFRRWYSGAGILPRHERAEMEALNPGLGIYYQYGLTEAGPIVTVLQPEDYDLAPGSIGRAVRNCEIRMLREDRTDAPPDTVGEIAVRGPAVMSGYFNRPEETAKVFHDGWLLTGDLGVMDASGFITFHDRSKDMIKTGGLNVYSQEVEHVLAKHAAVREVAVIGTQDDHWGEMVTAVITLHDGMSVSADNLIAFARKDLAGYQTPKRIVFMSYDELPKNYLGKVLKRELRTKVDS
ncbi:MULTISPECIES: AMP-binding protein [unclassified Afipia]|uniref:class I adenylate-forming enzyme family protein n=1 Tax=unclassified Afipia TaxID=2642050 RepID=UPI000464610C|nr:MULTISPECIES: AMP-binding protein [unclassified Afipia]